MMPRVDSTVSHSIQSTPCEGSQHVHPRVYVAVTSPAWHSFLAAQANERPEPVVFWRPSSRPFKALNEGELFLFKLRAPADAIVGGGIFRRFVPMPINQAWNAFSSSLGVPYQSELLRQIGNAYRASRPSPESEIGCLVLADPFFFAEDLWLPFRLPHGVQGGKSYPGASEEAQWLQEQVLRRRSQG